MAEPVLFSVQLDRETDNALDEIKRTQGIPKAAYIRLAVMDRIQRTDPEIFAKFMALPQE